MEKVLIVGVECVAGANLAAVFAPSFETTGLATTSAVRIEQCRISQLQQFDFATAAQIIQTEQPDEVVFCGSAARSCWDSPDTQIGSLDDTHAAAWASAAAQSGAGFTFISSDAVFTGPWMSHNEKDDHFCDTPQAILIRQAETAVREACPEALIVRTNVFGWSTDETRSGFAESILTHAENGQPIELDGLRHSAPILASDLAAVLLKAWEAGQTGVLHIAGAERINPCQFAVRVASLAGLENPTFDQQARLSRPVTGFGRGETMLDCRKARRKLGVSMPMIDEGIGRMLEQRENGFLAQLRSEAATATRVA